MISSDTQSDTREEQEQWALDAARLNGWTITRTFGPRDPAGISSGKAGVRKLLEWLLEELAAMPKGQRPQRILMRRLDRVGRMALDSIGALAQLRQLGVMIHTEEEGDLELEDVTKSLTPIFQLIAAELENKVRSQKWKAVHARRRGAGLHVGYVPFGVVLVDGHAVPYEPEAMVVRGIFERAEDGWGYTRLARWAREQIRTKRMTDGADKPYAWAPSSIKSILEGSTLRGLVIDEETWQRARVARAKDFRARSARRWPWPLQGAIRCTCGKMLAGHCAGDEPYRTRYYVCRYHTLESGQTTHPAHRADALERAFGALLKDLTGRPELYFTKSRQPDTEALEKRWKEATAELAEFDRRRQRTWELAERGGISGPQLRERLDEIDVDRQRARSNLETIRKAIEDARQTHASIEGLLAIISDLVELWPKAAIETQQEIARAVASLPAIGGLWTHPEFKGKLLTRTDVAKLQLSDDSITKKFIQSITE